MYGGTGSGLSSEGRRKARAAAHAKHSTTCVCGKVMHGNGWRAHARVCKDYLRRYGWEFSDSDREYLLRDFRSYAASAREAVDMLYQAQFDEAVRRGLITREEIIKEGE